MIVGTFGNIMIVLAPFIGPAMVTLYWYLTRNNLKSKTAQAPHHNREWYLNARRSGYRSS